MCNMKNGYNILSSHIYLSEIFAYVFFPRIHQPFLSKCMLQMRKHRKLNLIRICLWWTKVSEAVCKRDWHNVRLYLFINVQHFRLKNVKQWIVRYKLRIARCKLWPVRNKVRILGSNFFLFHGTSALPYYTQEPMAYSLVFCRNRTHFCYSVDTSICASNNVTTFFKYVSHIFYYYIFS